MSRWHQFNHDNSQDDYECSRVDCGVVVNGDAIGTFAAPCPTIRCTSTTNAGYPCVFAAGPAAPTCTYCGALGKKTPD